MLLKSFSFGDLNLNTACCVDAVNWTYYMINACYCSKYNWIPCLYYMWLMYTLVCHNDCCHEDVTKGNVIQKQSMIPIRKYWSVMTSWTDIEGGKYDKSVGSSANSQQWYNAGRYIIIVNSRITWLKAGLVFLLI